MKNTSAIVLWNAISKRRLPDGSSTQGQIVGFWASTSPCISILSFVDCPIHLENRVR